MKKILTLTSAFTMIIAISLFFNASASGFAINAEDPTFFENNKIVDGVLYYLTDEGHYSVSNFLATDELKENATEINIVREIDGIPVKEIDTNYSSNYGGLDYEIMGSYPNIKKITIPDTIEEIGDFAFVFFPGVEKLDLPDNLKSLGKGVFATMTSLKEIEIPKNITVLKECLFQECENLEKVELNNNITEIQEKAFMSCSSLKTIDLPDTLTYIDESAFSHSGLTEIELSSKISTSSESFAYCKSLKKLTIKGEKNDNISFNDGTFYACSNLKSIYITDLDGKIYMSDFNFDNCNKIKNIYFFGSKNLLEKSGSDDFFADKKIHYYYNHTHNFKQTGKVTTCKEGSVLKFKCKCGDEYKYKLASSTVHDFSEWKTVKNATVKNTGKAERTCAVCGKTETKSIDKLKNASKFNVIIGSELDERIYNNGKPVKLELFVSYKNKDLKEGVHYTVSYKNNKEIGNNAYVIIKGIPKSGYGGTKKVKFSVLPSPVGDIKKSKLTSSSVKLSWEKSADADGYVIYKVNLKNGKETEIARTEKTSYTVKNLKSNTMYRYAVQTYANVKKDKVYSSTYDVTFVTKK